MGIPLDVREARNLGCTHLPHCTPGEGCLDGWGLLKAFPVDEECRDCPLVGSCTGGCTDG